MFMKKLLFVFVLLISFSVNAAETFTPPPGEPSPMAGQDACQFAVDVQTAPGFYQESMLEGALVVRVQYPAESGGSGGSSGGGSGGSSGDEKVLKIRDFKVFIKPRVEERPDITVDRSVLDPTGDNFWAQNSMTGEYQRFQKANFVITDKAGDQIYSTFGVLIQRDGSSKGQLFSTSNHNYKLNLEVAFIMDLYGKNRIVSYMKYKEPNFYDADYALCLKQLKNITETDLKAFGIPPSSAPSTGGSAK